MDHCDTLHLSHAHITCPHCIKKEPNQRGVGHLGSVFFIVFPINKANTWKYPWAKLPISLCNFIWNLGYVFQRSDWRINNSKDWVSVSQLMDSEWKHLAGVPFVTIRCPVINKIQSCSVHVAITCNVPTAVMISVIQTLWLDATSLHALPPICFTAAAVWIK